jgi:hypothetical protein
LAQIDAAWRDDTQDAVLIALGLRSGRAAASERARQILEDSTADTQTRTRMIALLAKRADAADAPRLLRLVGSGPVPLQFSALDALPAFEKADLGGPLISRYSLLEKDVRARGRGHCCKRLIPGVSLPAISAMMSSAWWRCMGMRLWTNKSPNTGAA